MSIKAWPFLISRNQSLDYRTIVAPDFIIDAKNTYLLIQVADGDLTEENEALFRQVKSPKLGYLTVVFRVIKAKKKDIEQEPQNQVLKDPFGREIYFYEGIVIKGKLNSSEVGNKIQNSHLEQAHDYLKKHYKDFWNTSSIHAIIPATALSFQKDKNSPKLKLRLLEIIYINRNRSPILLLITKSLAPISDKGVLITTTVIALLIIFIWIWNIINSWSITRTFPEGFQNCDYISQETNIKFVSGDNGSKRLEEEKKKYPNGKIFLLGSLSVESPDKIVKLLPRSQKLANPEKRTIEIIDNQLKMNYYPIELAIYILDNQKVISSDIHAIIIQPKC
ncbi:MAG: hypothetical protein ACIWVG_10370 [Gloeotrichia echinulata HAB0833]|nr:hypothetical protein [Gloeotrichia echinulata DEX184]